MVQQLTATHFQNAKGVWRWYLRDRAGRLVAEAPRIGSHSYETSAKAIEKLSGVFGIEHVRVGDGSEADGIQGM